jgi:hypothetical protein
MLLDVQASTFSKWFVLGISSKRRSKETGYLYCHAFTQEVEQPALGPVSTNNKSLYQATLLSVSCCSNEAVWPRPDEWLPERWLPEASQQLGPSALDAFQPFSAGPRACIGRYFALLELQVGRAHGWETHLQAWLA